MARTDTLFLALLFPLLLSGCGEVASGKRGYPDDDIIRIAVPSDARSLDPAIAYDVVSWPMVRILYNGLIDYDDGLNLIPWQAESWRFSEDGRTLTLTLRTAPRFANGRPVTAQDYVFSIERILNPETLSPGQGFFRNIVGAQDYQDGKTGRVAGLSAVDEKTLVIHLQQPDPTFLHVLAMPFSYAVAQEEVKKHPTDFASHASGSGPFRLTSWERGKHLRFDRNPAYYDAYSIKTDALDVMVGGDETLHMMMFERGELDIANVTATGIPDPDFVRVMNDPYLSRFVESQPLNATMYISMNTEMPPFDKVSVRQAINYAVDRERILYLLSNRGVPARGVLPPDMPGYNPALSGYTRDTEKARRLLAEAGYPGGFKTELMMVAQNNTEIKIGQAVQQDLAAIGVQVELKPVTGAARIEALGRRKTVAFGLFAWYQDYPDPSNFLETLLNGERITEINSNNVAFYNNPVVNDFLRRAFSELDADQRFDLYRKAEEIIVNEAPWVFLYHPNMYILRQPWLKGMILNPVWPVRYEKYWIDTDGDDS